MKMTRELKNDMDVVVEQSNTFTFLIRKNRGGRSNVKISAKTVEEFFAENENVLVVNPEGIYYLRVIKKENIKNLSRFLISLMDNVFNIHNLPLK